MLLLIAALALQDAGIPAPGDTVFCQVESRERDGQIMDIALNCPDEAHAATDLQTYADARLEAVGLPRTDSPIVAESRVAFSWTGSEWSLPGASQILKTFPLVPVRAFGRGVGALCSGRVSVESDGRASDQDWYCLVSNPDEQVRTERHFERSSREAARLFRWILPEGAQQGCAELEFVFRLGTPESGYTLVPEIPAEDVRECEASPVE